MGLAMRTTRTALILPLFAGLSACSSAPPPPAPVPTTTPVVAQSGAPVAAFDLSPVPAPPGLFAQGRAKSMTATLATLGLGGAEKEMRARAVEEIVGRHGLRLDVDPARASEVLSLDAPVDFVAAVPEDGPPEPVVAVAMGLKSLDEARSALGATREFGPGMWAFGGERSKAFCVVAASSGPTPARAVCGAAERDVRALGGYLARTAPTLPAPASDASFELLVSPLEARFGADLAKLAPQAPRLARSELGIGEPQFDRAIEAGAKGLADEALALLGDVDQLHVDLTLSQQGGITLDGGLDYKGRSSFIARNTAAAVNAPVPPLFFHAPIDADSVTFGTVHDPADYAPMVKVGKDLIEGGLAKLKVGSEAERKKLSALLDLPIAKGEAFVSVAGSRMLTKPATPKTTADKVSAMLDGQMGWNLIGTTQKADVVAKWLKDAAGAYGSAGIQKELQKDLKGFVPTVKTPAPPAKLGKGAFELEVSVGFPQKKGAAAPGKDHKAPKKDAPTSISFHILVMADGDASWVAIGGNRDELVERLLSVKTGAPKDKTLDARADLQTFKTLQAASGGFMTIGSFRALLAAFAPHRSGLGEDAAFDVSGKVEQIFQGLPNKGASPIVVQGTVSQSPLRSRFTLNVPKGTLDDVAALMSQFR